LQILDLEQIAYEIGEIIDLFFYCFDTTNPKLESFRSITHKRIENLFEAYL